MAYFFFVHITCQVHQCLSLQNVHKIYLWHSTLVRKGRIVWQWDSFNIGKIIKNLTGHFEVTARQGLHWDSTRTLTSNVFHWIQLEQNTNPLQVLQCPGDLTDLVSPTSSPSTPWLYSSNRCDHFPVPWSHHALRLPTASNIFQMLNIPPHTCYFHK